MKYLFINSVYGFGSTGRIIADKCEQLKNEGHECAAAYPDRWQEYVTIRQEQNGNTIAVTFETKSGEETYELFKVLIGDDSSEVVGSLTDDTGTQRNVYLHVEELPADSGLEETEQTRFYAMQEDLNYLIDNLK